MDDQSGWDIFGGVLNNVLDGIWGTRTSEGAGGGYWPTAAAPSALDQYLPLILLGGLALVAVKVFK